MPRKLVKCTADQQHGRPYTYTYSTLVEKIRNREMESGEWLDKRNGFSINIGIRSDSAGLTYCTKSGNPLTEASVDPGRFVESEDLMRFAMNPAKCLGDRAVFRAIDWYLREKTPYLDPRSVSCNGRQCVLLKAEFCIQLKDCPKGYDDLAALMFGSCVTADDKIDLETYDASVIVYDAVFDSYPEKSDPPYHHRIESVSDVFDGFPRDPVTECVIPGSLRRDHTPRRLFGRSDVVELLTEHEGLVLCLGRAPHEHWVKIKPDRPVALEIVAVLDTVGMQEGGFDKILIAATDGENCHRAVDLMDLTDIFKDFDRVKQGKAFVNPASIRRDPVSGVVGCKSTSSLGPMLSAIFGQVGLKGGRLISSPKVINNNNTSEVRVNGEHVVKCGTKRSFHRWFKTMLFLENPVRVTMSANEYWLVPSDPGEVHLQASRVLSVGDSCYGPIQFRDLTPVSHTTLLNIATNRFDRNPTELFRLSGVGSLPFADLPGMKDELFTP